MHRSGGTRDVDEVDRRLCDLLGRDPRLTNRALATAIGITDETVAARLRRLRDQGVLATTIIVDWEAAGFGAQAFARVHVAGVPFRDIAPPLFDDARTLAVTETSGACDGVLTVVGRDHLDLHDYFAAVAGMDHVREVSVEVLVADVKPPPNLVTLPIPPWDPTELPNPRVALDDLDLHLVRELARDGHESNSEVARRLNVSDATIRRRTARLEDAGLIEVVAAFDPVATGDLLSAAFAFCSTQGTTDGVVAALRAAPYVITAYRALGSATLVLLLGAPTDAELQQYVNGEFRRLPNLAVSNLAFVNEVLFHRSHLARVHRPAG